MEQLEGETRAQAVPASERKQYNLTEMLLRKFPAPEWATSLEVANRTGSAARYADAVAFNLWSSRGHVLIGFECKVYRSDWLRELKNPAKSDPIQKFCDQWYVVAAPDVVKLDEVPATWGLMEARGTGLHTLKMAPKLTPEPLTRGFIAAFVRRAHESVEGLAAAKIAAEREDLRRQQLCEVQRKVDEVARKSKSIIEKAEKLKEQTGIDLMDFYNGPSMGDIKLAQALVGKYAGALPRLLEIAAEMDGIGKRIRESVAATGLFGDAPKSDA